MNVVWQDPALDGLRNLPSWRDSEEVVRAVNRFAETAEGLVYTGEHLGDYRLAVGRFVVWFKLDGNDMLVQAVRRRR